MGLRYVTRDNVFEHALRARLMVLVEERPGLILVEAGEALGVGYATLKHHLDVLHRFGCILVERSSHDVLLFPANGDWPPAQRAAVVRSRQLRNPVLQHALHLVHAQPGITLADVMRACGVKRASLRHHVDRLVKAGLITEQPSRDDVGRRCVRLYPVPREAAHTGGTVAPMPIAPAARV